MGADEPLSERSVQTAGDGILDGGTIRREKRPDLERVRRSITMGTDHPDRPTHRARPQASHDVGVADQDPEPTRTVVDPLRIKDLVSAQTEHRSDLFDGGRVDRPLSHEGRRGKRQAISGSTDRDKSARALLHDAIRAMLLMMVMEPGVAGAEGGMTGEGKLGRRSKDARLIVSSAVGWREHKGRLRQVRPPSHSLHVLRRQAIGFENDRHRIPEVGLLGEHIDLSEWSRHHHQNCATPRHASPRHATPRNRGRGRGARSLYGVAGGLSVAASSGAGWSVEAGAESCFGPLGGPALQGFSDTVTVAPNFRPAGLTTSPVMKSGSLLGWDQPDRQSPEPPLSQVGSVPTGDEPEPRKRRRRPR